MNPELTPFKLAQNKQLREELRRRRDIGDVMIQHGKIIHKTTAQNFRGFFIAPPGYRTKHFTCIRTDFLLPALLYF